MSLFNLLPTASFTPWSNIGIHFGHDNEIEFSNYLEDHKDVFNSEGQPDIKRLSQLFYDFVCDVVLYGCPVNPREYVPAPAV